MTPEQKVRGANPLPRSSPAESVSCALERNNAAWLSLLGRGDGGDLLVAEELTRFSAGASLALANGVALAKLAAETADDAIEQIVSPFCRAPASIRVVAWPGQSTARPRPAASEGRDAQGHD
jgi:hypothetical protein